MKRVINGKMYNTATADLIIEDLWVGVGTSTDLYRNENGEFFYANYTQWDGQRASIEPISEGEAKEVIGDYDGEIYAELFGDPEEIEEVEKHTVYVVTFLNDCEWELPNVSVNVFGTLEKARECLDKEWQTLAAEHEYDEEVSKKNDDDFLFEDSCANRTIGEIRTLTIN